MLCNLSLPALIPRNNLISITTALFCLRTLYARNHTECTLLCLAFSTQYDVLKFIFVVCINSLILPVAKYSMFLKYYNHRLMDQQIVAIYHIYQYFATRNKMAQTFLYRSFCKDNFSFIWGKCLEIGLLGDRIYVCLNL